MEEPFQSLICREKMVATFTAQHQSVKWNGRKICAGWTLSDYFQVEYRTHIHGCLYCCNRWSDICCLPEDWTSESDHFFTLLSLFCLRISFNCLLPLDIQWLCDYRARMSKNILPYKTRHFCFIFLKLTENHLSTQKHLSVLLKVTWSLSYALSENEILLCPMYPLKV